MTKDVWFLAQAVLASAQSTCIRRNVGCILVDDNNHVMATGYNGVPRGHKHCINTPCPGANYKSGEGLNLCYAIHAEQNALLQCSNVEKIVTCYTTTVPCVTCTKLLLNTGCQRIVSLEEYSQSIESRRIWNRLWEVSNDSTRSFISSIVRLETPKRVSPSIFGEIDRP